MLPTKILVPTDFSEHAERATRYAIELARKLGASVHLLHAYTIPVTAYPEIGGYLDGALLDKLSTDLQRALDQEVAVYQGSGVPLSTTLKIADARDAVVDTAKQLHSDLIVIGTHGRRGVARAVLGSVAESVVRSSPCPVLTVH